MPATDAPCVALVDHVSGHGPIMLLLHGGTGSHHHWARVVEPLSRRFRIHAPDLPGYGESPSIPDDTDGDAYVALAAQSLARLLPAGDVDLVGFSFGGGVAAGVARAWGDRVRRLTLIGPGGFGRPVGRQLGRKSRAQTDGSAAARRELVRHNLAAVMLADPGLIDDALIDLQLWHLDHARFDSLRVSFQDRVPADIAAIACPVQLIWGTRDIVAHPSPEALAERVRTVRPDARIHYVPGAGHWAQFENPDAVVRLLNDFHAPDTAPAENP